MTIIKYIKKCIVTIIKFDYFKIFNLAGYFSSNFRSTAYLLLSIIARIHDIDKFGVLLRNSLELISAGSSCPKTISRKFREVFYAGARILREIFPTDVCYVLINARALTLYYKPVSWDLAKERDREREDERERERRKESASGNGIKTTPDRRKQRWRMLFLARTPAREEQKVPRFFLVSLPRADPCLYVTTELRHSRNDPWEINESRIQCQFAPGKHLGARWDPFANRIISGERIGDQFRGIISKNWTTLRKRLVLGKKILFI